MSVSTQAQVRALVAFRLAQARGPARGRLRLLPALFPLAVGGLATAGALLPRDRSIEALVLLPTAWLAFAVSMTVAGVTGAASRELLPRSQGSAFPVSPAADHLGAVLMAPLNLAWMLQSTVLVVSIGWATGPSMTLPGALASTLAWIIAWTCLAQTFAWWAELLRSSTAGTWTLRALGAVTVGALTAVTLTGSVGALLNQSPTIWFVISALSLSTAEEASPLRWMTGLAAMAVLAGLALAAGPRLLAAAQRAGNDSQVHLEAREHPRRRAPRSELVACTRIDRAGVWRSAPMRRGLVALVVTPAVAAALAGLDWTLVVLLPGLVASGAGLLFGVNAFALDGTGALWRATLPGSPRTMLAARAVVITEVCLLAAALAALASSLRAPTALSAAQAVIVLCAVLAGATQVVSRCVDWSVRRPYAAALRDARDQPAPPAVMAYYSLRFALATTTTGLVFSLLVRLESVPAALALLLAVLLLGARRVRGALRHWDDPVVRLHVLATVASARA